MSEWIWINGEIMPMAEARLNVEDRGFQFADGVYEVIRLYNGRPFALDEHLARLERSAEGIQLSAPMEKQALAGQIEKFLAQSGVGEGMIYLQLTRGVAPRNHVFPASAKPTLLFYARPLPPPAPPGAGEGVKLLAVPDERWKRCWIKSIALLPNVLARNAAIAAGADEAVFVEDGIVTECSISNFFAVMEGKLFTHPPGSKILSGITRKMVLECAGESGLETVEQPIPEEQATHADELFITSTTRQIQWVVRWNNHPIGQSRCGPMTKRLHQALQQRVARATSP